ncbi:helix-turn-helix domain-containing protein [Arthrobacter jiangjiafuii]|uniref:Helix-turn-helix domain-containing protein n=1 Tax=Arthrobacter jiangjiafuii TaxID=2817475 RepID=A0A975M2K9_9MICC|nr:IclR family transcriptional regulator C-terminal domain-containing protein [Arthrobacter jiangjiafuii]MBP3043258.1 helix-turn-helix domain-containing protein [Arthrobacter jiangjiafuii]QWC08803.1 helix-turn-helix domain-containing protein [Arthrobacter jiangjiafuii]
MGADDPYYVKSVEKTFAVLGAFTPEHPRHSVSSVAAAADLSRAAARRFLLTLCDLGYLSSSGSLFELAPRSLDIGSAFLATLSLPTLAEPHLKALAAELGETTSLCILDGMHVVYVARVAPPRLVHVSVNVGTRFPAWATSMGRVLIAALEPEAREAHLNAVELKPYTPHSVSTLDELRAEVELAGSRGWARVSDELEGGLRGVAVPVSRYGSVVAAANVSLQMHRDPDESLEETVVPLLRSAAQRITADLNIR